MTDIIDKVAEALAANHYSERFGKPKDDPHVIMNAESQSYMFRIQATAALEALAERLVWDGDRLLLNGVFIGCTPEGPVTKADVLNAFRKRLFGLGPVGEENG